MVGGRLDVRVPVIARGGARQSMGGATRTLLQSLPKCMARSAMVSAEPPAATARRALHNGQLDTTLQTPGDYSCGLQHM